MVGAVLEGQYHSAAAVPAHDGLACLMRTLMITGDVAIRFSEEITGAVRAEEMGTVRIGQTKGIQKVGMHRD